MAISSRYECIKNVRLADGQIETFILCDNNGAFFLRVTNDCGNVTTQPFEIDGTTPYVPVGTVTNCTDGSKDIEQRLFCDDNSGVITPYLVAYEYDESGAIIGTTTTLIDGVTPYVPTGIIRVCAGEDGDVEFAVLCDDGTEFMRHIIYDNAGSVLGSFDTELDGSTPYVVSGTVATCPVVVTTPTVNLIPNPLGTDQSYAVSGVATDFATLGGSTHANTTHILIRFEVSSLRVTFTGTAPTSGVNPPGTGIEYRAKDVGTWAKQTLLDAKFIETITGVSGYIQVSEFMEA